MRIRSIIPTLILATTLAAGCSDDTNTMPNGNGDDTVPEFALDDVNPTSARSGQTVSPRDYLGSISAYYFGHST